MRNTITGAAGCLAALTLPEWSTFAAIAAGGSTALWMLFQIVLAARRDAREEAAARVQLETLRISAAKCSTCSAPVPSRLE